MRKRKFPYDRPEGGTVNSSGIDILSSRKDGVAVSASGIRISKRLAFSLRRNSFSDSPLILPHIKITFSFVQQMRLMLNLKLTLIFQFLA